MKKYDVLIVGNLCSLDTLFAEYLSKYGLKVCVIRKKSSKECERITDIESYFKSFDLKNIEYLNNPFEFLSYVYKSKLIVSFTGSLIGQLKYLFFIKKILFLPPVIHISTGSDMSELVVQKSLHGALYRNYLKFVDMVYTQCYPHILNNIIDLKLKNIHFDYSFPFYVLKSTPKIQKDTKEITFFNFSNIDWQATDNKKNRNSSKGTNKFLNAFFKALENGLDAKCVILDRGPDKELAKEMINNSKFKDRFIWKPHLTRDALIQTMRESDVLVDQFDIGGLGMGAIEGMSLAKPVMMYVDKKSYQVQYLGNLPPLLNCKTQDEIYEQIMKCNDNKFLDDLGEKAREWVVNYHQYDKCMDEFIFHYQRLTGHRVIDYVN